MKLWANWHNEVHFDLQLHTRIRMTTSNCVITVNTIFHVNYCKESSASISTLERENRLNVNI